VRPESIHLTLKFLGEISSQQQETVIRTFSSRKCGIPRFELNVRKMGFFPNSRAPRVAWMSIEEGSRPLEQLARFVEESLVSAGFPPEDRLFSPHATIGRVKFLRDVPAFLKAASQFREQDCGWARVEAFHLYESQLSRGGSIYTKRATFELE
jgi:2'-5' RNA ligase